MILNCSSVSWCIGSHWQKSPPGASAARGYPRAHAEEGHAARAWVKQERYARLLPLFRRGGRAAERVEVVEEHPAVVRAFEHGDDCVAALVEVD
jgi:hypothetical protein